MKKSFLPVFLVLLISVFILSCEDSTSPPQPCETSAEPFDLGGFFALKEPYNAIYTATKTGDAVVHSITYVDDDGAHVVNNPEMPWEITVTITSNDTKLSITGSGTSANGGLEVKLNATDGNTTIKANDSCSHQSE